MVPDYVINKLQRQQNKCLYLINGKEPSKQSYKSLGILQIRELIKLENCKFGFKLMHNMLPTRITELSLSDQHGKTFKKSHQY